MIRLRPLRRSEIVDKDRASLGARLAHISEMLGSLSDTGSPHSTESRGQSVWSGERVANGDAELEDIHGGYSELSVAEFAARNADLSTSSTTETEQLTATETLPAPNEVRDVDGQHVANRVSELSDLIDAEFTHMWEADKDRVWSNESQTFEADNKPAQDSCRRRFPRHESGCIVSVCQCGQTVPLNKVTWKWRLHASRTKGDLLDISMGGLALLLESQLVPGDQVLLRIRNPRLDQSIDCSARVVRTIEAQGGWRTVCDFHESLTLDTIHRVARRVSNGIL